MGQDYPHPPPHPPLNPIWNGMSAKWCRRKNAIRHRSASNFKRSPLTSKGVVGNHRPKGASWLSSWEQEACSNRACSKRLVRTECVLSKGVDVVTLRRCGMKSMSAIRKGPHLRGWAVSLSLINPLIRQSTSLSLTSLRLVCACARSQLTVTRHTIKVHPSASSSCTGDGRR